MATNAGIESTSTDEQEQVVLRLFAGLYFDKQQLELLKDGIKVGTSQLRLNPKRIGKE